MSSCVAALSGRFMRLKPPQQQLMDWHRNKRIAPNTAAISVVPPPAMASTSAVDVTMLPIFVKFLFFF